MSTDPRLVAFLTDGGEVFSGVQQGQNLWKPDPFDVESINAPARQVFKRLLERAVQTPPPDSGKLLLLRGDSGSGKTHLVRTFRNLVHGQGQGYVGYMPMTVDTPSYDRYILSNLLDSLDRPYGEPEGPSGLLRLSSAVLARCNSAFAPLLPDLDEDELHGVVSTVVTELQQAEVRFSSVNVDLLRALLSLQRKDVRLHHAVLQWLRCKDLSAADRRVLADFQPRLEADDPKWMLEQLGHLMGALNQALVLCVDQVEEMSDFRLRPSLEAPFRQAMSVLAHLAGNVPSVIVVICCLADFWIIERQKLARPMLDRIEQDPEPVLLDGTVTAEMARDIAALRLKSLYSQRGVEFDPAHPTWPYPAEGFEKLGGHRTRDVLNACRRYREQAIRQQRLPEHFPLPDELKGSSSGSESKPGRGEFNLAEMEQAWTNFRSAFQAQAPEEEEELAGLLSWALEAANGEREGEPRFSLQKRDETSLDLTLHPEGSQLRLAICNKSSRGGHLGRQMAEALQDCAGMVPVLVRTTEFPATTGTTVAEQLIVLKKKGGRLAVLGDGDLRELVALRMFWRAHTPSTLREWSRLAHPITRLRLISDLLGLERTDMAPLAITPPAHVAPAAPPAPAPIPTPSMARSAPDKGPAAKSPPPPSPVAPSEPPAPIASSRQPNVPLRLVQNLSEETPPPPTPARTSPAPRKAPPTQDWTTGPLRVGTQEGIFSEPITLEPGELTRHTAFLGGTGSGKTTLALNVLEQLLLRGIPAILVDRKGDLAGYAREEAWQAPMPDEALAERRRLLRERVDVALYTPGRSDGRPLAIPVVPRGLEHLSPEERDQGVQQAADAIAGMLEYKSSSRDRAARALLGQALQLLVQRPLDQDITLETIRQFVEYKDPSLLQEAEGLDPRVFNKLSQDLAMLRSSTKTLLSTSDERLDLTELLGRGTHGVPGRTRLSIISTKFLGTTPSVLFWVSQLLLETNRWASQNPSTRLQAVLLFDEADLYLPAIGVPATKQPMENLLKRARSAGIGVMLATQSPGDLDYKCRENVATWFVGLVKEDTALKKLKPMFSDARGGDFTARLATQKQGQFHLQRQGRVQQLRAERNILLTEQLPEDEILRLARLTRPPPEPSSEPSSEPSGAASPPANEQAPKTPG